MASLPAHTLSQVALDLYLLESSKELRKGQRGRIAIVGGSLEYTGAPYFVASASENLGADIAHIFCHPSAAVPIKAYSPTVIVHPIFQGNCWNTNEREAFLQKISSVHTIVLGPGLGYDDAMVEVAKTVIQFSNKRKIWLVVDADAFRLPEDAISLLKDNPYCIMTPNTKELQLLKDFITSVNDSSDINTTERKYIIEPSPTVQTRISYDLADSQEEIVQKALDVFQYFKPFLLLVKGDRDYFITHDKIILGIRKGCLRRCGGQGDLLAGAVASSLAASGNLCNHYDIQNRLTVSKEVLAVLLASCVVRDAAYRSESTSDKYISAVDILNAIRPTRFQHDFPRNDYREHLLHIYVYTIQLC